jgi:Flp pilus assembly pilin Flp
MAMKASFNLLRDRRGVAAIEYALVASLISIAAIGGYSALGGKLQSYYGSIDNKLSEHM